MAETQWPAARVRQTFIDFFVQHGHVQVPSCSVVPLDDPTLLFTNAGMNQFKPIFLGTVDPHSDMAKLKRAVDTQKCIRAGGKHNDLDDVGKDVYHHTFFEMLGNWSFGDYFKKETIDWSWELLTEVFGLEPDRLYVTYFGGDEAQGLSPDNDTRDLWLKKGLDPSKVMPFGMKDNFWEMGETGPCGPCSEVHYDRIGGRDAAHLVNMDDPDVLEIWNLVFMQFNREAGGVLRTLPNMHIDTGMGFERVVSVLQKKSSNYDTDVFAPIFAAIQSGTGARPYTGKVGLEDKDGIDMAYRVLADHVRTLSIAISDGGLPGNTGRNYVLRRIVRRAIRYADEKLQAKPGLFASLVPVVVQTLGTTYPELVKNQEFIQEILLDEEKTFLKTLRRGRHMFELTCRKTADSMIPGHVAWRLYDTYGFPLDLVVLMAEEKGLGVDITGYEAARENARLQSQGGESNQDGSATLDVHAIALLRDKNVPPTDDSPKYDYTKKGSKYEFKPCTSKVVALLSDKQFVEKIDEDSTKTVGVLLDRTCFYGEQGGQINDIGFLLGYSDDCEFTVRDCQVYGGYVLHVGVVSSGTFSVNDTVTATISEERRVPIMANHTATHLLNFALRDVVSESADQKGSLVLADRFRFDFASTKSMTTAQLDAVQVMVNDTIKADKPVQSHEADLARAREVNGLRCVFGEVYPDPVRVVAVGFDVDQVLEDPSNQEWRKSSIEFCGGTHVLSTGTLAQFVILSEEAIAKGVRRIVAITGDPAKEAITLANYVHAKVSEAAQMPVKDLSKATVQLTQEVDAAIIPAADKQRLRVELKNLKKKFDDWDKARKAAEINEAVEKGKILAEQHATNKFLVAKVDFAGGAKALDSALKHMRVAAPDLAIMLLAVDHAASKVVCMANVPKSKVGAGLKAGDWVASVCPAIGGKGGGKEQSAQATGTKLDGIDEAVAAANALAQRVLG